MSGSVWRRTVPRAVAIVGGVVLVVVVAVASFLFGVAAERDRDEPAADSDPEPTATAPDAPATTGAPVSTTARPVPDENDEFIEAFDQPGGLERFRVGVAHRDDVMVAMNDWVGDHEVRPDGDCGPPTTGRTVQREPQDANEFLYVCESVGGDAAKGHLMTSVGDTSGYSVAWFSPEATFDGATTVSWDVNVTDLGSRQWWEVMVAPAGSAEAVCGLDVCARSEGIATYPAGAVVVGNGPFGSGQPKFTFEPAGTERLGHIRMCTLDPEGCESKAIRRTWTMSDNGDGTISISFLDNEWTMPGSFPDEAWQVVFKDHSYTPNKNGEPVGYTWHWDNIVVS